MPYSEQYSPRRLFSAVAHVVAGGTVALCLWIGFGYATGIVDPYPVQEPTCGPADDTDSYLECLYGPLDLTPIIEDEAQTKEGS